MLEIVRTVGLYVPAAVQICCPGVAAESADCRSVYASIQLVPEDQLILYTDGITETMNPQGELLGTERLDEVLMACRQNAGEVIRDVLARVEEFAEGRAADDDRTIVVARIS